ncbi:histidine utilization repressor [Ochrobactrum sp. RH2CCR150]|uniref:histidine utilization repressor n=1 Tax=Ochrobactrum sp. RH2CCR150 TaxID=2587044 RepID=UPI0015F9BD8E|nr:GntR family histidine utilization transcriptional repressor [Ochrobactrum sp. RH2CCR150]
MGSAGKSDTDHASAMELPETAGPLYEKVKAQVLENIRSGRWPGNFRLPSEHELVDALGISRMTVNRALRELTDQGILKRIQGVGTFVSPPKPETTLIEVVNIANEIVARGGTHRAQVVALDVVQPDAALLNAFELQSPIPVAHSIIVHFENDVPVQLEERFVNTQLVQDYELQDFRIMTTYDYLQKSTPMTEVEQVISAVTADAKIAALLQIEVNAACLHLDRRTWTRDTVATVNKLIYAGDRYRLGSRYKPEIYR